MSDVTDGPPDPPLVHEANLDSGELDALLGDIERAAELLSIRCRGHASTDSPSTVPEARLALHEGRIRAVQFRYRFEDAVWVDTVQRTEDGFRLVRTRQEFLLDPWA